MPITIQSLAPERRVIPHTAFSFSGGERQVRIEIPGPGQKAPDKVLICAKLFSSDDIMDLMLVTDALRRQHGGVRINLQMPYFPYARQDRVCYPGEALGARVMAETINALGFHAVEVWDAHSSVTEALLDRCHSVPAAAWARTVGMIGQHCVVAPDAGATKRALLWAQQFQPTLRVIEARKVRDPKDGSITGARWDCPSDMIATSATYLMVDDICDGGRTFCELAKVMRQTDMNAKILLFVTHGIFSKGFDPFRGLIDRIYCPNVWPAVPEDELLTRL